MLFQNCANELYNIYNGIPVATYRCMYIDTSALGDLNYAMLAWLEKPDFNDQASRHMWTRSLARVTIETRSVYIRD